MREKLVLFTAAALFGILSSGCEENDPPVSNEILTESINPIQKGGPSLTFYVDMVPHNFLLPEVPPNPEMDYNFNNTYWSIENGQYVATAHAYAMVRDRYTADNCEVRVQVMLIKNGQVYEDKISTEIKVYGTDFAAAHTNIEKWYFSASTDLSGVFIVSQFYMHGCFDFYGGPEEHRVYWADSIMVEFDLGPDPPENPPSPPTNLTVSGTISPVLNWDASTNADYYNVYRTQYGFPKWSLIGSSTTTTYTDHTVITTFPETWFQYKVVAVNEIGSSNYSNTVYIEGMTGD